MKITYQEALNLLGLRPGYTEEQLKKAYRAAASATHPDKHPERDTTEEFKQINNANELLKQYLKDPVKAREAERAEQKRREAERAAEERKKQAQRDAEEKARREAEAKEQRRREEEEKKREAYKKSCEVIYSAFYQCKFFRELNISLQDFYIDRQGLFTFYENLYNVAKDIYSNAEKYIRRYENRHSNKTIGIRDIRYGNVGNKIKTNGARRVQRRDYASRMYEEFGDFTSALTTTYKAFFNYRDYAYVLDELDYTDLKNYILLDDEGRERKKDEAEEILVSEDLFYAKGFMNSLDKEEFKDIHNRRFRDNILLINDIRSFTNENVDFLIGLLPKVGSPEYGAARSLINTFKKNRSYINTDNIHNFRAYLYSLMYQARVIYSYIPREIYNINGDFNKLAQMAPSEAVIEQLYLIITRTPEFTKVFADYEKIYNTDIYRNLTLTEGLKKFIARRDALNDVHSYYGPLDLMDLALLSDSDYDTVVKTAVYNKNKFAGWIKADPKYKEYMTIYRKYPELFKGLEFERAFDNIKAKCNFIEDLHLAGKTIDLFKLPEQELMQRAARKKASNKIKFIMEHNQRYHPRKVSSLNLFGFDDDSFEIERELSELTEVELDALYAETFIAFANAKHPEFRVEPLTMELYKKLVDEDKDAILADIYRDQNLRELAKRILELRLGTNKPIYTYEDLLKFDDNQIMNLELELWNERMIRNRQEPGQGTGGRK